MKKGKQTRHESGNNPAPRAGAFDAAEEDKHVVPPHQAVVVDVEHPQALPVPDLPEPEPKRSFIDRLADGFRQIPSARLAHYRTLL